MKMMLRSGKARENPTQQQPPVADNSLSVASVRESSFSKKSRRFKTQFMSSTFSFARSDVDKFLMESLTYFWRR